MILPEGHTFGDIRGLIRCTPEQALEDFGFVMSPSAEGIILRGYTYKNTYGKKIKGTFVSNYIPPGNPQTIPQQAWRDVMKDAVAEWKALHPYVQDEWRRKAKGKKASGYNLFLRDYLEQHH